MIDSAAGRGHYPRPRSYPAATLGPTSAVVPVVVVGAGPVGLATALGLARRGVRVTVLEAATSVSSGSRAICVSRHSLEILDRLGAGKLVSDAALPWTGGRSFYRNEQVLAFEMPLHGHDVHPPMVNISQGVLEQLLVDVVEATPGIRILWGVTVTGCRNEADTVELTVRTEAGEHRLTAGWVVAADGATSGIRRGLGLRMTGTSYEARYVIADIHWPVDLPTERRVWFDPPGRPGSTIIMHRQPDDIWRIDYQLDTTEDADAELAPDRVRERIGRHLDWLDNRVDWTLEWSSIYRAHALSLPDYVHGRIVFAGDAAHLVPIFGVRGLNSGLEDADTLAWQLAAVLHGAAGPRLLDAYSVERRDAWRQNIEAAAKSTRFMSPTGPGHVLARDAVLALAVHEPDFRPLVNPRQSTASHLRSSPLTWPDDGVAEGAHPGDPFGDQVVQVVTPTGMRASTLSAELGIGFAVVGFDLDADRLAQLAEPLVAAVAPEPVRALAVSSGRTPAPPGTVLLGPPSALAAGSGEVLVVRPDGALLCRVLGSAGAPLAEVAEHLRAGIAPAVRPGAAAGPTAGAESPRERTWTLLSSALDEAGDREAWLTRLALVLGSQCEDAVLRRALRTASGTETALASDDQPAEIPGDRTRGTGTQPNS